MQPDVVQLAQALVRIPSVNPMGRSVSGPEFLEGRVTDFLEQLCRQWNLPCERHEVLPGRDNLLTRVEGQGAGRRTTLLLEVHQDTVPVVGMSIDPWGGEVHEGRLFGRGACDVKGGMAAMLAAFGRRLTESPRDVPHVVLACTVNEENGFDGAKHLRALWEQGSSSLLPACPDAAVVAEPTDLAVVTAHKGTIRWRCHTRGRAAHSCRPHEGENAIYAMSRVVAQLERYAHEIVVTLGHHPQVGHPTLNVGTIQGGVSVNTVPDRCTIEIDRRLLPGESPVKARDHVIHELQTRLGPLTIEHDTPFLVAEGLSDADNTGLARTLASILQRQGLPGHVMGVEFGTDASTLAAGGVPTVVFGPGSIEQAHTKDEWIELAQLRLATNVLYELCCQPEIIADNQPFSCP